MSEYYDAFIWVVFSAGVFALCFSFYMSHQLSKSAAQSLSDVKEARELWEKIEAYAPIIEYENMKRDLAEYRAKDNEKQHD